VVLRLSRAIWRPEVVIPYENISVGVGAVEGPSDYYSIMIDVDLTSLNIAVVRGQQWAFAVKSDIPDGGPQINIFYGCENNTFMQCGDPGTFNGYPGGERIEFSSFDHINFDLTSSAAFQTFISPVSSIPEPSTLALLSVAMLMLGIVRHRHVQLRRSVTSLI
jgi:hypothetical protein